MKWLLLLLLLSLVAAGFSVTVVVDLVGRLRSTGWDKVCHFTCWFQLTISAFVGTKQKHTECYVFENNHSLSLSKFSTVLLVWLFSGNGRQFWREIFRDQKVTLGWKLIQASFSVSLALTWAGNLSLSFSFSQIILDIQTEKGDSGFNCNSNGYRISGAFPACCFCLSLTICLLKSSILLHLYPLLYFCLLPAFSDDNLNPYLFLLFGKHWFSFKFFAKLNLLNCFHISGWSPSSATTTHQWFESDVTWLW